MLVLVDTNVVLRTIEPAHAHHASAVEAQKRLHLAGHTLVLVPQIHYEFWVAATRPVAGNGLGMTTQEATLEIAKLGAPLYRFFRDERAVYSPWLDLVTKHQVQGKGAHDARLVAAMLRHGIAHLLTFNVTDFQRYAGIQVLDPAAIPTI